MSLKLSKKSWICSVEVKKRVFVLAAVWPFSWAATYRPLSSSQVFLLGLTPFFKKSWKKTGIKTQKNSN